MNAFFLIDHLKPIVEKWNILKADLDGKTFVYDCRMRFLERALLA